ncbi:MFS transporter [Planotetraspora kaengkrachanensis]|uniref:MFS transporter n=1 Tax=Planotetraspora kaengkrachanensis TaxID=575193 RepID=A0A8J3PPH0_9ACTN|nr:MFS transporter [Planotetraspora kaengkrachanensis]GIG77656.1 MFS transporter [Planotetraspora kaengkrachanensis]
MLAVVLLAVFSYALLQSLVNPVLPRLQKDLHTTQSQVTWIVTAYLLSASIFTPIMGRLGDRYGKDRILIVALVALAAGSLVSAVAPGIGVMIAGRAVQGVGGGVLPMAFGIIRDEVPPGKVPAAIGATAALTAVGGGAGIVLAGPLVDALGVRSLFWIPLAMTALAAVAAHFVVPPSRSRQEGSINWASALLMAGWLLALLLPLAKAPAWGWSSPRAIGLLVAAVVLAGSWFVVEARSPSPLVDMRMMRVPAVWTTNLVALLLGIGLFSVFGFLPAFVQTPPEAGYGFGASVTEAGLLLLPMTVMMFVAGLVSARWVIRLGARTMFAASTTLNVIALAMLAFEHDRPWQVLVAMALLGVAFGSAFSTMSNVIVAAVRPEQTGVANGVNVNVRTIGGSLGAALMGGIVSAHTPAGGLPTENGYVYGFAALGAAGVIAALAALLVPGRKPTADAVPGRHERPAAVLHQVRKS